MFDMMRIAVAVVTMLVTSAAHADTRFELDNLLPPDAQLAIDPAPAVDMRPKSDHRIDMLTAAVEQHHNRLWRAIDLTTLVVSTASLVCDWGQTHGAAAVNWHQMREGNPILGPAPSTGAVNAYFVGTVAINTALWLALPERYRSIIPIGVTAVQVKTVGTAVATHSSTMCGL